MRLRFKFIISFAAIALIVLVLGVINVWMAKSVSRQFETVLNESAPSLIALGQIKSISLRMVSDAYNSTIFQPVVMRSPKRDQLTERVEIEIKDFWQKEKELDHWISEYRKIVKGSERNALVVLLHELQGHLREIGTTLEVIMKEGIRANEISALQEVIEVTDSWLLEVVDEAIDVEIKDLNHQNMISGFRSQRSLIYTILFAVVSVILAVFCGIALAHVIASPIEEIKDAAQRIGAGDLDCRIKFKSNDEIGDLAVTFNRMVEALQKTTASKEALAEEVERRVKIEEDLVCAKERAEMINRQRMRFLANISPSIRMSLNAILGFLPFVRRSALTELQKDYLSVLEKSERAFYYIIDMLDFIKLEAGELFLEHIDFNIVILVNDLADYFAENNKDDVKFVLNVADNIPVNVNSDPTRIRQILTHVIRNAFEHTSQGSVKLNVSLAENGDDTFVIKFCISDTGEGISKQKTESIFSEFMTLSKSFTKENKGVGLGLSLTYKIVELFGGDISVESKKGEGSAFCILIPVKKTAVNQRGSVCPVSVRDLEGKRIAVILAEKVIQDAVVEVSEEYGLNVIAYSTLVEAEEDLMRLPEKDVPKCIICDFLVSEINDYAFLKKIKSLARYAESVNIAVSVQASPGDAKVAQEAGFNAFIQYNDIAEEFILVLRTVLGDSRSGGQIVTKYMARELFLRGIKVLVVEDDEVSQRLMCVLIQALGSDVVIAPNGQVAVETAGRDDFDVILMDVEMPVMDGIEAVKIIRKNLKSSVPVIALTAHVLKTDVEKYLKSGFNDCLTKPVDLKKLKEKLLFYMQKKWF